MAYTPLQSEKFKAEFEQLKKQYPHCAAAFKSAMLLIETGEGKCGISTNRGLSYVGTREHIDAPGHWICFNLDEAKRTVTYTDFSEKPRTLLAEEVDTEE